MSKRERNLLVFLLVVVVLYGFYYFIMQHQLDNIANLETNIETQEVLLKAYERNSENLKTIKSDIALESEKLEVFFEPYLKDLPQEHIILLLEQIMLRSNVKVDATDFVAYTLGGLENIQYEFMETSFSVYGSYKDVVAYVSSFLRFDHNIFVKSISLSKGEVIDDVPMLSGDLTVAFVRVDNDYASEVDLFEWYDDNLYEKENPFDDSDFAILFSPNYFYTGTDVEFYNPPFEGFNDVAGHWAEEVINFFGRNGYVLGDEDNNINPEDSMTRLETVILLDNVFRWELSDELVSLETFDDYDQIADLSEIEMQTLLKAYNSGYLFGYEDNTLRPYNAISYQELGFIGANLLGDENVTWLSVAREIEDRFNHVSPGLTNDQLLATKAEIIYFLAYIQQQQ